VPCRLFMDTIEFTNARPSTDQETFKEVLSMSPSRSLRRTSSRWLLAPDVLLLPTPPPSPAPSEDVEICLVEFLKTSGKWIENTYCPRRGETPYTKMRSPGECDSGSQETWSLYSRDSTLSGFSSEYGIGQESSVTRTTPRAEYMIGPSRHSSPSLD